MQFAYLIHIINRQPSFNNYLLLYSAWQQLPRSCYTVWATHHILTCPASATWFCHTCAAPCRPLIHPPHLTTGTPIPVVIVLHLIGHLNTLHHLVTATSSSIMLTLHLNCWLVCLQTAWDLLNNSQSLLNNGSGEYQDCCR